MRLLRRLTPQRLYRAGWRRLLWPVRTWQAANAVAKAYQLRPFRVLLEQATLYNKYGLNQEAYYHYRLYEPTRSMEAKGRYLSYSGSRNHRLCTLLNPPRYRSLYDNKLIFNRFFGALGLPLARILAVYYPRPAHTADGYVLGNVEQLERRLVEIGEDGFVIKPMEGIQGHRILVFTGRADDSRRIFKTLAGERYDAAGIIAYAADTAELVAHNPGADPHGFLVEERIRPHPDLAAFVGPTLCTVRVQTLIARDGLPRILAAVFKLQPGTSGVDHLMYGGVGCWVDQDTGTLGRGRTRVNDEYTTTIPGTDRSFVGFRLPGWEESRQLALKAAAAFPWARSIGWDIGISDRGPVVIEGNERWSPSLIQMPAPDGLYTGELKAVVDELTASRKAL